MPPSEDRPMNGRGSPYSSRRPDSRSSGNVPRTSKDERRSEEGRSDDRSGYPPPHNSTPRIPSGPRVASTMLRPNPSNPEKSSAAAVAGSKPVLNSTGAPEQMRAPPIRQTMDLTMSESSPVRGPDAYKEVLACLVKFTQQVTETAGLSFKKDKAMSAYKQKQENYDKTSMHHTNYPPVSDQQKKNLEIARINLDKVQQQVAAKEQEAAKTMESLAARIVSGGVDTTGINRTLQDMERKLSELEKRVKTESDVSEQNKSSITTLNQNSHTNLESVKREFSSIRDEITAIKSATANDQARSVQSQHEKTAISNLGTRLDGEMTKIKEELFNTNKGMLELDHQIRLKIGSMDTEVKQVKEAHQHMDSEIKKQDSKWEHHDSLHKTLDSRHEVSKTFSDDIIVLKMRITALEARLEDDQAFKSQATEQKRLAEDLAAFRKRIDALESRPLPRAQSTAPSIPRSSTANGTANEDYSPRIEELSSSLENIKHDFGLFQTKINQDFIKFQEDNDDIYGNSLDEINGKIKNLEQQFSGPQGVTGRLLTLESDHKSLKEIHNTNVHGLTTKQSAQFQIILKLQEETKSLLAILRPPEPQPNHARGPNSPIVSGNTARLPGSPIVNSADPTQLTLKRVQDDNEALKMGFNNLNTRFNSLTTDALARQMWSQLDNVHPHLKDATKGLQDMNITMQKFIKDQLPLVQRVETLEKRPVFPAGLKESLEGFDRTVTALKAHAKETDTTTQSLQKQIDVHMKKEPLETSKKANGKLGVDRSSSESVIGKRKASGDTNGNSKAKRLKSRDRRVIQDSDDEASSLGNGHSDAISPPPQ